MTHATKSIQLATVLLAGTALAACGGPTTAERRSSTPAEGISSVRIISEAGDLSVSGGDALTAIAATGTVVEPSGGPVDGIDFKTSTSGSELLIEARTAGSPARFNIAITLPRSLAVKIEDGDGNIAVQDVAALDIIDGNGEIAVRRVAGLALTDTAGGITVGPMTGNVDIRDDGMGDMTFRDINGNIFITRDSAGVIEMTNITGNAEILTDGDGDIVATNVSGNFTVRYDTSGRIRQTSVGGTVTLPSR